MDIEAFEPKKLTQESIALAVAALSDDIQRNTGWEENLTRAQAIKTLAEAYILFSIDI